MSLADQSAIRYLGDLAQFAEFRAETSQLAKPEPAEVGLSPEKVSDFIVGLSSDYYWESDAEHRVVKVSFGDEGHEKRAGKVLLGKKRWETGTVPLSGSWDDHKAIVQSCQPFKNFLLKDVEADGFVRYLSVSGMPCFSDKGKFKGYIGASRDVTADICLQIISELEISLMLLLAGTKFNNAMRGSMRLVCKKLGWPSARLWVLDRSKSELRLYDSTASVDPAAKRVIDVDDVSSDDACVRVVTHAWERQKKLIWTNRNVDLVEGIDSAPCKIVAVPLKGRSGPFAVMEFLADRIDYPRTRLSQFLTHLATQIGIAYDRDQAAEALRESKERFASTFELAAIGICHVGNKGQIIHVNQRMIEMLGYSHDELLTKTVWEISHHEDRNLTVDLIAKLERREIGHFEVEKRYICKNGNPIWVRIKTVIRWGKNGESLYHVSVVEDISKRKLAEEKIEHMATHDELTGLPNRVLFNELVNQAIKGAERNQETISAVLFVDLDRFKIVNDSLGHQAGDKLLRTAAKRLKNSVRASDCIARFGGDEFVLFLNGLESTDDAETVAENILFAIQQPLTLRDHECRVTASIGIALYPEDGDEPESLIRGADAAMYAAKQNGKNAFKRYSVDMTPTSVNRIRLEAHLRHALERQEFRICYQPKVDAKTDEIIGVEALLRWWDRELGTISPAQFVPIAEETGLIIPIGRWVLQMACQQQVAWCKRGLRPIRISVNLSPKQFSDPKLLETVRETLEQTGMDPHYLELEITESMLMCDLDGAIATATELRNLGIRLAIDDFGTGYSSLMQLKRFPLDTLKIDRSFIRDLPDNQEDCAITEAIIAMGKTLGVSVVAEGVEQDDQSALLKNLQCDEFQGFLFGKPSHPDEIAAAIGQAS